MIAYNKINCTTLSEIWANFLNKIKLTIIFSYRSTTNYDIEQRIQDNGSTSLSTYFFIYYKNYHSIQI